MSDVLTKARDRLHSIRREIEVLVEERDRIATFMRVYEQFSGEAASEKAVAVPPAEEVIAPSSSAPITEAPKPLPDDDEVHRPAEAKTSDQEPSVSDGSGGAHDGLPVRPATQSTPDKSGEAVASPAPTLTARIAALIAEHPDWSGNQIHKSMPGTKLDSVKGIVSAMRRKAREAAAASQKAPPPTEPKQPPASPRAPIASIPSGSGSAIVTKPMVRPKGTQFYLRNDAGEYLHCSCESMTGDRNYAWRGNEQHLVAVRRRFPLAQDLREQVIEKEQARAA